VPELRIAAIGFAVLAPLGYAVNDSGIVVPGLMLAILIVTLVTILVDRVPLADAPATQPPKSAAAGTSKPAKRTAASR
jgi:uncharacterized membrane protein